MPLNKVIFIHKHKAHLPEIQAYMDYFIKNGFDTIEIDYIEIKKIDKKLFKNSILWYFMGFYPKKEDGGLIIHDYRSLSIGKIARIKDLIKKKFNFKPDLRVFLNEEVKENLGFRDNIPFLLIDMGLPSSIIDYADISLPIEYDFVYVGAISYEREIHKLIRNFINKWGTNKKLLLVGMYEPKLKKEFDKYNNIIFTGRVKQDEVFRFVKSSNYAICIFPNKYPHFLQTPTKLLEYLALRSRIIVNENPMVLNILKKSGNLSNVFIMDQNWNFPDEEDLKSIKPTFINIEDFLWENILKRSNILETIKECYENKIHQF